MFLLDSVKDGARRIQMPRAQSAQAAASEPRGMVSPEEAPGHPPGWVQWVRRAFSEGRGGLEERSVT